MKPASHGRQVAWDKAVLGILIALIVWASSSSASANGGTVLLSEELGAYDVTVTASPYPLRVGLNDISVLLGRPSDGEVVLDGQVEILAEPIDLPGEVLTFTATHANATNKLYYAANVTFPNAGQWKLTVNVDGPEGPADTTFNARVERRPDRSLLKYSGLLGVSVGAVVLFFLLYRRAEGRLEADGGPEA